jgi:multicomponent K+:H+ antiporter subunit G
MTDAELPRWIEILISALLIFGGFTAVLGALGLVRFNTFFARLHAPTKTSTLGIGGVLLGSMVYLSWVSEMAVIHQILIAVFVFMTAPISAHQMAKAMLDANPEMRPPLPDSGQADSPRIDNTAAPAPNAGQDHDQIGAAPQPRARD